MPPKNKGALPGATFPKRANSAPYKCNPTGRTLRSPVTLSRVGNSWNMKLTRARSLRRLGPSKHEQTGRRPPLSMVVRPVQMKRIRLDSCNQRSRLVDRRDRRNTSCLECNAVERPVARTKFEIVSKFKMLGCCWALRQVADRNATVIMECRSIKWHKEKKSRTILRRKSRD